MNLTVIFAGSTVMLAAAVWHCYKSNKPLREKAREEAQREAERQARSIAEGREKDRRNNVKRETLEDFEWILRGEAEHALNREYTGMSYSHLSRLERKYPEIHKFLKLFKHHEFRTEDVLSLKKKVNTQAKQIADLQLQQAEILKALRMGQPVE
ncbi:DNA ligase [Pseudomonas phage vB_PpuP-Vasula]